MQYYASKISDNMAETPEGFLLCKNVPIARTGPLEYAASELPGIDTGKDTVTVYREAADVFSETAMASFEGKPVTDEHPDDSSITPENATKYQKGNAQNIRRNGELLIADLMILDAGLISKIKGGKRDVSCGYKAGYEVRGNKLVQVGIEGNHVAVVDSGRAGSKVAIKDSAQTSLTQPNKTKRRVFMKKTGTKTNIIAQIMNLCHRDSKPDELAEVLDEFESVIKDEAVSVTVEKPHSVPSQAGLQDNHAPLQKDSPAHIQKDSSDGIAILVGLLEKLIVKQDEIMLRLSAPQVTDSDPLDELEAALLQDSDDITDDSDDITKDSEDIIEDSDDITEDSEDIIEDSLDESEVLADAEDIDIHEVSGATGATGATASNKPAVHHDSALAAFRKMKPIIANIKNPRQKRIMTDSLSKIMRPYIQHGKRRPPAGNYQKIAKARRSANSFDGVYMKDSKQANHLKKVMAKIEARRGVK